MSSNSLGSFLGEFSTEKHEPDPEGMCLIVQGLFFYKNGIGIDGLVWFVGFYGISTFVGYLTPNTILNK